MKKIISYALMFLAGLFIVGCENYLDKSPDDGLTEDDLYKDYASLSGFMDAIFINRSVLIYLYEPTTYANGYITIGNVSDEYASIRTSAPSDVVNSGNWLLPADNHFEIGSTGATAIARAYTGMRIVNRVINNIDKVQNITTDEYNKLLGQASFLRAYFYFELIKRYGGMPKLDTVFGAADDLDYPRLTYQESNAWMQTDLDTAIECLPDLWDESEHGRPDRVSALALKTMTQLYASSPLMQNDLNTLEDNGYSKDLAAQAAVTAQKTISAIESSEYYRLMDSDEYRNISFIPSSDAMFAQPEYLWFLRNIPGNRSAFIRANWLTQPYDLMTGSEGTPYNAPTQNMVDLYEKKGDGDKYFPISDSRANYDGVNAPYEDRDPRFTNNILVPGEAWGTDQLGDQYYVTTYQGGYSPYLISITPVTQGAQQTGYMCKKYIWPEASSPLYGSTSGFQLNRIVTVYIRVAQVYLDMAEASYEATGGNPDELVTGCSLTAREALNVVRNRAGIGDLPDGVDFREAYRRERAVELMFEGHRWYDIRRWMIAEELFKETYPIKGVNAIPQEITYSSSELKQEAACKYKIDKFKYEYIDVTTETRIFNKRNYWYPFPEDEMASLKNVQQNPGWN